MKSAQREAKKSNKRVEIASYRSETATTFANPDGKTLHTEVHTTPIRVNKGGTWQTVDPTLVEENGVIRPKAVNGDLVLSSGGEAPLVKVKNVKGKAAVFGPGQLPKPELAGNTATYKSAYGEGVDLVVTATATGFTHEAVIRERPSGDLTLRVPVDLPKGMKYGKGSDGTSALVTEEDNKSVAAISAVPMLDALATGSPDAGHTGTATTAVDQGADDSAVVVTPDDQFLADPAVVYPVRVALPSDDWTGTGIDGDTFVNNAAYPNGASNNNLNRVIVGKSNTGTVTWRGYIRFNIKGTPLEGGTVENADLRLWNYDTNNCSDTATPGVVARRVNADWQMSTLTWNNQPSVTVNGQEGNRGAYGINCPEGEGELYYSIEQMVQAWMDGSPDYGVQLSSASEDVPTNWRWYRSNEYGYDGWPGEPRGPVLIIKYVPKPVQPKARGFIIPGPTDGTPPTVEEVAAHLVEDAAHPTLPILDAEQTRALREDAKDTFMHDSGYGFHPVEEATREEWLAALDPAEETAEPETDSIPPVVVSTDPAANANDVPVSAGVRVTFDEPVANPVFTLKDAAGTPVQGAVTFSGTMVSFVPAQPLATTTTYTAEISGTVDVDGNAMAAPHSWSFTTASTSTPVEGLVAAYGMEEGTGTSVGDASGLGNTGEARDTTWVAGKHGQALAFNGSSSWITVADAPSLRLNTGMTLSAWVKPATLSSWRTVILKELPSSNNASYGLYASNGIGNPSGWLYRGSVGAISATSPLPLDTWSHVAVTYDGTTARLYVDGNPAAETPMVGSLDESDGPLDIGGNGVWGEFFQGEIDEVRIYNIAQNSQQISTDMNTPIVGSAAHAATTARQPQAGISMPVDGALAPPPAPSSTAKAAQVMADPFPYGRVDQKKCQDSRPPNSVTMRWIRNSFNVCYTALIGETLEVQGVPTNQMWAARISVVVHSYVGYTNGNTAARGLPGAHSRQIKVWIKVDKFFPGNFPGAATRQFSVHANNTSSCTSDKPDGVSDTAYSWTQGADREITLTSPTANSPAPEHFGYCAIQPSVYYPDTDDPAKRVGKLDNERVEFRCDSLQIFHYAGGCVVWSARPTWHLDGNEEASKQTAAHIWKALNDPQATDTKYPGQTKKIPGKYNPADRGCKSQSGCLTRSMSDRKVKGSVSNLNYRAAKRECRKLNTSGFTKPSCDEYPFASTHEGVGHAGINYSVAIVECNDNSSGGTKLKNWYFWNRVLEKDPFWVHVTKDGQTPPEDLILPDVPPEDITPDGCDQ
ncbi:LamG-like jellyroll fold domain-containing protein [Nonomuraea sp. NPDC049152]|uniref:LamG-like jellyroll fold domain-containing protein n=1 Tax=Nonomuraea sp. NPDC049152 TaxID=3154350 RepID=UPI0033FCB6CD